MRMALGLIGMFLVAAFITAFWKLLLGVALLVVVIVAVGMGVSTFVDSRRNRLRQQRGKDAALAIRAQAQHEQYLAGDSRGIYGNYRPASLD